MVSEGDSECPDCPYGGYSYATFEGGFSLVSYEWVFEDLEGHCVKVKDTVEMFGSDPVFVMDKTEGYNYETYWFYCD